MEYGDRQFAHLEDAQALRRATRWLRQRVAPSVWRQICRRQYRLETPPGITLCGAYRALAERGRCHVLMFDGDMYTSGRATVYSLSNTACGSKRKVRVWQCATARKKRRAESLFVVHTHDRTDLFHNSAWRRNVPVLRWHC